jgi:flagellar capping protein FliD
MAGISFNGVASGIQWGDIVDQLIAAESARSLTPLQNRLTLIERQRTAWGSFNNLLNSFQDVARQLRTGELFGQYSATGGLNASTGQAIVTATAGTAAAPGTYSVEVLSVARAQKLSSGVFADPTTALGFSGTFTIAGREVTIGPDDTLGTIRDTINSLNSGSTPTRVSAALVSGATGGVRLVLTSDVPGADGAGLQDGADGVLRQLGIMDSRTRLAAAADQSIASAMDVASPGATTISVNGRTISLDLGTDSLNDVAARLRAAGVSANVVAEPYGHGTGYRLQIGGHVTATGAAGSAETVALLAMDVGVLAADNQIAASGVFTSGGGTASGSSSLVGLMVDGSDHGIAAGDAIHLTGTRGDGTTFTVGLTVQAGDTLDTLIARFNDQAEGLGGGTRPAQAMLGDDGRIRLVDSVGGDSQLSFTLSVVDPDGQSITLGSSTVEVAGRAREVTRGAHAQVLIDGVLHETSGTELVDAIPGVTLKLEQAAPGAVTELTIARDETKTVEAMQKLVETYNAISSFVDDQRRAGQPLASNSTLRGALGAINNALRTEMAEAGDFTRAAVVGLSLDRYGKLQLDETRLKEALAHSPADVKLLFGSEGIGKALEDVVTGLTRGGDGTIAMMTSSLDQQKSTVERRQSDVERRLEMRREHLTAQFIAMESLVSQLQNQGSWLAGQLASLQPRKA